MTDVSLYGLGCRTVVTLSGRVAEAEESIRHSWSRCLAPRPGEEDLDSGSVHLRLRTEPQRGSADPGETAADRTESDDRTVFQVDRHDLRGAMQQLTQQITYAKIQAQAGRLFMLHASAVANPGTGAALAFVAPGGTGKTTLARQLGQRYCYLTDETAGIGADGRILPYPKPLSIRETPASGTKIETSPDDLRLWPAPERPTLSRIILLARSDDHHGAPRVEPLSLFQAIGSFAPETSSLSALPRPLHWLADLTELLQPTVRLHYREADSLLDLLATWLEEA